MSDDSFETLCEDHRPLGKPGFSEEMMRNLHDSVFRPNEFYARMERATILNGTDNPEVAALWAEMRDLEKRLLRLVRRKPAWQRFKDWVKGR